MYMLGRAGRMLWPYNIKGPQKGGEGMQLGGLSKNKCETWNLFVFIEKGMSWLWKIDVDCPDQTFLQCIPIHFIAQRAHFSVLCVLEQAVRRPVRRFALYRLNHTDPFTNLQPQSPSYDISEQHKNRRLLDFEVLKMKCWSQSGLQFERVSFKIFLELFPNSKFQIPEETL